MEPSDKQDLVDLANKLSLQTVESLNQIRGCLAAQYGPHAALTLTVDALLIASVSMIQTAVLEGSIPPCDVETTIRKRLDYILSLPDRFHHRRADGSFDPVGMAMN